MNTTKNDACRYVLRIELPDGEVMRWTGLMKEVTFTCDDDRRPFDWNNEVVAIIPPPRQRIAIDGISTAQLWTHNEGSDSQAVIDMLYRDNGRLASDAKRVVDLEGRIATLKARLDKVRGALDFDPSLVSCGCDHYCSCNEDDPWN